MTQKKETLASIAKPTVDQKEAKDDEESESRDDECSEKGAELNEADLHQKEVELYREFKNLEVHEFM